MIRFTVSVVPATDEGGCIPSLCMYWSQISEIDFCASAGNKNNPFDDTLPSDTLYLEEAALSNDSSDIS